ncbi:MAG TPA: hypothetical protein VE591_03930 [Candidatus Acidoferrum sp.]|nr:hypothetical protein [Candidatus Acidoferrum sp.]
MRVPTREELAAIAVAYRVVAARPQAASVDVSRWRLAGRLPIADAGAARNAARVASRWKAAGRVRG